MRVGSRWKSTVDTTEVMVIRGPAGDVDLRCGGRPMVTSGAPIESVVTRGADETRFSQPPPAAAAGNGGNGVEEPSPAPAITNTPPG